ncbi:MAG: helix-turn-helix transcriptional regulator [Bacteroides sp.]|nr:helix-turn-helix transcriptional regulator [Bacteroides sp.]
MQIFLAFFMTQIGKNIKKLRNTRGLSQQAFAELFGLSRGNISSYEEMRAEPRIETILQIAKYFGIPVQEFIEKELSVNDLLHYNTHLVLEAGKLKTAGSLTEIPYLSAAFIPDYLIRYRDEEFVNQLPRIVLPTHSPFRQIALEVANEEVLPAEIQINQGDLLVCEEVRRENAHRLTDRLGISIGTDNELRYGIYREKGKKIILCLNEWIHYPFHIEDEKTQYWVLKGVYRQRK